MRTFASTMTKGRFPNLLVIGAMKAGTTSLHEYLNHHPAITMSDPKEIHYYADEHYGKMSEEEYKSNFIADTTYVGTSPQSYTKCHNRHYQNIPERIFKDTPEAKLIYIVRDPIERYLSNIFESYCGDPQSEIDYNFKTDGFVKTSMYAMQLKAYLKFFKLDQIHVLSLEDLRIDPLTEMNRIFDFLGLDRMDDQKLFTEVRNSSDKSKIPYFVKTKFVYRLLKRLNVNYANWFGKTVTDMFYRDYLKKPELSEVELGELKQKLKADIEEFRKLTDKEFSNWSV